MNTQREIDIAQLDAQLTIKKIVETWSKEFFRQLAQSQSPVGQPQGPAEPPVQSVEDLPPVEGTY